MRVRPSSTGWSVPIEPSGPTVVSAFMLDFDAYLRRIGLDPSDNPTWQAVHRAHATTIPFENLDSHRGLAISLEQADLERKLVANRRGGYCFEHNLLLASALEQMGLKVEPMLARVRVGGAPRETRPAGHLVLRATDADGRHWHADVGRSGSPLTPGSRSSLTASCACPRSGTCPCGGPGRCHPSRPASP